MNLTTCDVKKLLSQSIQLYRAKDKDKFSYNYIGTKTKLSPSYIERAAKNRLGEKLDPAKIISLSTLVCAKEDNKSIANYFAFQILNKDNSILKDAIYAKFVVESQRQIPSDLEKFLQEEDSYIPYALSAHQNGTTVEQVKQVLGEIGVAGLNRLVDKGLITKKGATYHASQKDFSTSFETLKKQIPILARLYKPSHVGKERNYAHIITEGLSREGIKKWQKAHREHLENLKEIFESNPGKYNSFSVAFMDTFSSADFEEDKNEK